MKDDFEKKLLEPRMTSAGATFMGGLALTLTCIGIFGLVAYTVSLRTKEIGIRLALGAGRDRVVGMVLRESVLMVVAGILAGLPLAYFLPRLVDSLLYGLEATDPGQFVGATLVLLVTAIVAAWIPAWRASRLDPMTALREE